MIIENSKMELRTIDFENFFRWKNSIQSKTQNAIKIHRMTKIVEKLTAY